MTGPVTALDLIDSKIKQAYLLVPDDEEAAELQRIEIDSLLEERLDQQKFQLEQDAKAA